MKKVISVILAAIMILSIFAATGLSASAADKKALPNAAGASKHAKMSYEDGEIIDYVYAMDLGEERTFTVNLDEFDADYIELGYYSPYLFSEEDIEYDEDEEIEAFLPSLDLDSSDTFSVKSCYDGMTVVFVDFYKYDNNEEYDEFMDSLTYVFVARDPEFSGELYDFSAEDIKVRYKANEVYGDFQYDGEDDTFAYTLMYLIDADGEFYGDYFDDGSICPYNTKPGTYTFLVYAIDCNGNVISDTFDLTIHYTFWQHLIRIFLFGWIWY